jgi:hypothetical protein
MIRSYAWLVPVLVAPRWWPLVALVAWAGFRPRGAGRAIRVDEEIDLLGRLVAIGLSGGLPPSQALAAAAGEVDESVGDDVRAVLRGAARTGLGPALAGAEGPAGELLRRMAGAQASGAPVAGAVLGFVDTRRAERRSRLLARIRSLPVVLSVPVAFLLLPGFVLSVVGPAVVQRVGDFYGPLVGR